MTEKLLPFHKEQLMEIIEKYPTPFHIYDEAAIRANARRLVETFAWAPEFKEFFAVKATPNPYLLKLLKEEVRRRLQLPVGADAGRKGRPGRRTYNLLLQ